jgi:DNA primase
VSFISKSTIQEVNNRLDAVAVVEEYVHLEKKGGRWWGKCPFHSGGQERTASFTVDPDIKTYYCFGCNKGGGVIGFVMEMEKLAYPQAIKSLAGKMGIEIVYENGGTGEVDDNTQKEELYELYRRTTTTYQHFLLNNDEGKQALRYISERGINNEMIEKFKLGYAPAQKNFLFDFLTGKGYSEGFLEKSGLFLSNHKTISLFSGRLIFPIADRQGRIIAFGGRALPGQNDGREPPKYINSSETEIYKKGQALFAFDLALPEIRRTKTVYLAEGYMDVIAMFQAGVTNAVAPLGTAFTEQQANLLRRFADTVVLVFDSDEAGQKAVYKSIILCRKNGLSCTVSPLKKLMENETPSDIKDPAEILQKFGENILKKVLNCTIYDSEYLFSCGKSLIGADGTGKNRAIAFLFPYLEALDSEVQRDECIALAANYFGVAADAIHKDYSMRKTGSYARKEGNTVQAIRMNSELFLLTVVSANFRLYPEFRTALEIKEIDDPAAKELFIAMEECYIHDESGIDSLLLRIENEELRNFITRRGLSPEFKSRENSADPEKLMEDGINGIRKKRLLKRLSEIGTELNNEHDGESINDLLEEKMFIDSQIRKFEGRY